MKKDALGARIKRYEQAYKPYLTPRSCLFVRVDGKAFHTFTRDMGRPFDHDLIRSMVYAASQTARGQMQGCIGAYVQSDECTFMLTDFATFETQGWFDYELNKVVSVSASSFTYYFNEMLAKLGKAGNGPALFDSRAFIVPIDDAPNVFVWRQKDWQRNSLQMLARANYSHKELDGKSVDEMREMLAAKHIYWERQKEQLKNGTFLFSYNSFQPDYRSFDYDSIRQRLDLPVLNEGW